MVFEFELGKYLGAGNLSCVEAEHLLILVIVEISRKVKLVIDFALLALIRVQNLYFRVGGFPLGFALFVLFSMLIMLIVISDKFCEFLIVRVSLFCFLGGGYATQKDQNDIWFHLFQL